MSIFLKPPPCGKHLLDKSLAPKRDGAHLARTRIALVGAGGNGSQMVTCLARMDRALRALGLPALDVTLHDPDRVTASNVGRQLFYPDDVGQSKAVALIHRANLGFGLDWHASPSRFHGSREAACDVLITCVDTGAARREIYGACFAEARRPAYWLDIGNEDVTGQVWLGQFPQIDTLGDKDAQGQIRLPHIMEAMPHFFDGSVPESEAPSCSLAEALQSQDLFINDMCARMGAHLLWTLLRYGEVRHHGYWINLRDGSMQPVPVPANAEAA